LAIARGDNVLTVQPAKNIHGKLELLPSPDLFFLTAVITLARRQTVSVATVPDIPILQQRAEQFKGHLDFTWNRGSCTITPVTDDPSVRISFPTTNLPWRDLTVFTLLGLGKTVVFQSVTPERCGAWQEQARRLGATLDIEPYGEASCLTLSQIAPPPADSINVAATDLNALLGILLGRSAHCSFLVDYPLSSPLRPIASAFGFTLSVRSSTAREHDEIARRIRLMQQKNRQTPPGQQFSVEADFTRPDTATETPLEVTLPGDETAGVLYAAAKCLFPKSSFTTGNMPLESWATPYFPLLRKMGCRISVQETGRTSFGSVGILHLQCTGLTGRKLECVPAFHYTPFLPSMIVIAAFAEGKSVFRGLSDLRLDTPDGIADLESCVSTLGVRHGEMPDGIVLKGGRDFDGFDIDAPLPAPSCGAFAVAGLRCIGGTTINDEQLLQRLPQFYIFLKNHCEYRT
jgi:hypothetical protein